MKMPTSNITFGKTGSSIKVIPVDEVSLEARAASLATRSIKTSSKKAALHLTIRCIDLTTLEGADTPEKVASLCQKAKRPDPSNHDVPSVAAVCVYPEMVHHAVEATRNSKVKVASVAGAFPSGLSTIEARTADISDAVKRGADEIDIVLNRSAFLSGDEQRAFEELSLIHI